MINVLTKFELIIYELTAKQLEVIKYLAMGYGHKKVALLMNISPRTVEVHIGNITRKFDIPLFALVSSYKCTECKLQKKYGMYERLTDKTDIESCFYPN